MNELNHERPGMLGRAVERYRVRLTEAARQLQKALIGPSVPALAPPPGADTDIGKLLWTAPQPLLNPKARILLIFSQKAACTNLVIWFFHHLGHLQAGARFHRWPHEYRERVYYASAQYRAAYKANMARYKVVRVVRDPYERAASGFRHMLGRPFADAEIARRLGYRDMERRGLSFATYLDFLETLDLASCDPHFRIQRHPIEDRLPLHHLINIPRENLFDRLNDVEAALRLPKYDLRAEPWLERLHHHNRPRQEFVADGDLSKLIFTRDQARHGPWPGDKALLTPEARARIARLYAVDVKSYG